MNDIHLWGVKQNNLKDIEIKIPIGSFTVVCGPSGSGKSSLAFETLYAEGQRRYIESLSNYSKQFLNKAPKPDVDGVENIPPAISLEQKNSVKSSRSSVGTTTEVLDYLRVIYEKLGKAYCSNHKISLEKHSPSSAAQAILDEFDGKRGYLLTEVDPKAWEAVTKKKATSKKKTKKKKTAKEKKAASKATDAASLLALLLQEGVRRIYIPKVTRTKAKTKKNHSIVPMGEIIEIDAKTKLPKTNFHLVVDRLAFSEDEMGRMVDSLAQAYSFSMKYNPGNLYGRAECLTTDGERMILSEQTSCPICEESFPDITSALFSFNSPVGACENCKGFGNVLKVDEQKVIPNPELSIAEGVIKPFAMPSAKRDKRELLAYCRKKKIDVNIPWNKVPKKHRDAIWKGDSLFYGVMGLFDYLETKKYKMHVRVFLARHKSPVPCDVCHGSRYKARSTSSACAKEKHT